MARLGTYGAELGNVTTEGLTAAGVTIDTTQPRSGKYAFNHAAVQQAVTIAAVAPAGATVYSRAWVYLTAYPPSGLASTTNPSLLSFTAASVNIGSLLINNTGVVRLASTGGAATPAQTQVGSNGPTISLNNWFMVELACRIGAGATDYLEARVNGVSFASSSSLSITDTQPASAIFGWADQSASPTMAGFLDDLAVNDSSGASQTSWPGIGKVVLLKPISDNARAGFGVGAGTGQATTTNLWDAVDNAPPTGVAIASSTAGTQIKDKANNSTDQYTANLAAYTTSVASGGGGMNPSDTISVAQAVAEVGQDSTTATSFGVTVTNPTIAEFTGAAPAAAAGTAPTNWARLRSAAQYAPTPTLGSSPTVKVRKATSSSTITMMADFMGLMVEYVPAPASIVSYSRPVRHSLLRR